MLRSWLSKWRRLLSPTRREWDSVDNFLEMEDKYEEWALDAERPTSYEEAQRKAERFDY